MDEVDNIIIHSLREIGCTIDNDITSLSNFSPELLVKTVSKCLILIKPSIVNLPMCLPHGMAQKFAATNILAETCAMVGFRGDIGYQTFLYSNEGEVRRVFMFLIERLPKEIEKKYHSKPLDFLSNLEQKVYRKLSIQYDAPWMPYYCNTIYAKRFEERTLSSTYDLFKFNPQLNCNVPYFIQDIHHYSKQMKYYWIKRSPSIFQQTNYQTICPTLIHKNEIDMYYENNSSKNIGERTEEMVKTIYNKSKTCTLIAMSVNSLNETNRANTLGNQKTIVKLLSKSNHVNKNYTDVHLKQILSQLHELRGSVDELKNIIDNLLFTGKSTLSNVCNLKESCTIQEKNFVALKNVYKIKERTYVLLKNPVVNMSKMENVITLTKERINKIKLLWEEHQSPLIQVLAKTQERKNTSNSHYQIWSAQLTSVTEKSTEISKDLKFKNSLFLQLLKEYQKVNKSVSRSTCTTRILEIICNIRKQKNDINNVLRDTRSLQKQISIASGQLDRQFTVTDDLLFKTAKRFECSRKAYKLLVTLHSDCSSLVTLVQDIGSVMRDVRDVEDEIELEKSRNILINLEKIWFDLNEMKKERQDLQMKIFEIEKHIIL